MEIRDGQQFLPAGFHPHFVPFEIALRAGVMTTRVIKIIRGFTGWTVQHMATKGWGATGFDCIHRGQLHTGHSVCKLSTI